MGNIHTVTCMFLSVGSLATMIVGFANWATLWYLAPIGAVAFFAHPILTELILIAKGHICNPNV